jgi:putative ABC transport system substrate-binding protein
VRSQVADAQVVTALRRGLNDVGHSDVSIEFRFADGQFERLPTLAAELLGSRVAIIVTIGDSAAVAAKKVTSTIPVVFSAAVDPVELGLVKTINRPGMNATGLTSFGSALVPKRLEILRELVPRATAITVLINPKNFAAAASTAGEAEAAAARSGGTGSRVKTILKR